MKTLVAPLILTLLIVFLAACRTTSNTSSGEPRKDSSSATGFYVPRDLDDALIEVNRIMGEKGRADVLKATEDGMIQYHFGLGMWIRNNWIRGRESRLARYFNQLGIRHPDDMSGIILDSYWRKLHSRPIDLEGQVRYYQDFWMKAK